jgi:multisubunit Na+/H+ antiporter MnhB subunit
MNNLWYAFPLVIAVSLVYAATRHEEMAPILRHAARVGAWIAGFMGIIFAVLFAISWNLSG